MAGKVVKSGMEKNVRNILFMSNGHGEDLIATRIIQKLVDQPGLEIRALPVVGTGAAYSALNIPLIVEGHNLPSGGFVRNGLRYWRMDLRAGLFALTMRQIRALRLARDRIDLAVCVGDNYLTILAGYFLRRPIVLLPTAKSNYVSPHWPIERRWMRRFCVKIFPRDSVTTESLTGYGLPAEFLGNVMMDSLDYKGSDLQGSGTEWTIGILPGSRSEAYLNIEDIAQVVLALQDLLGSIDDAKPTRYLAALTGALSIAEISERLTQSGWTIQEPGSDEQQRGITGHFNHPTRDSSVRLTFTQGRFADVLAAGNLVIGLAGTANEQAAGLGKPVVAFVGRGTQYTGKFAKTQKKLLGDSLSLVDRNPEIVAREVLNILSNRPRQERMAEIGRERMGGPGGAQRIAAEILNLVRVQP
jgi:uncharacterized protein (TIGR03492 family)